MGMRGVVAAALFHGIQIVGFPLALVGYLLFVVRLIRYSRRSGVSSTVLASFYTCWMQHKLGTLRAIAGTASGSAVPFDYFSAEFVDGGSLYLRYARAVVTAIGEPFKFGIDSTPPVRERVAAFLRASGLSLEEQRNFGPETDRRHARAGFATAVV